MAARSTSKQFVVSVFFSFFAVALNYLISLVLTPFITENIGTEAYGFVSLAKTFANYASIFTVALNAFSARYISIEYHKGNKKKANVYYNSVFIADVILAIVIFGMAVVIIINLNRFLMIPEDLIGDVKKLFLLDTINFLILSCGTVFMTATTIKNRLEMGSIARAISYIAEAVFLFIAFSLLTPRVYYVGIGLIVSSCVILLINIGLTARLTPDLKVQRGYFSIEAVKSILSAGIWSSVNSLGNTLNTGLDLLVSNMMLSALVAGQLAIVKTISTIFTTLFQLVATAFQPMQLKYYANNDKKLLISSFKLGIKLNGMISNIAFAGFTVFGAVYYKLWTPSQDIGVLQTVTIMTIIGGIIEGAVYPLYYGYNLTVKNKIPCFITIFSGLMNVFGMYVLIEFLDAGIYAVVLTTTVLTWMVNFVFNPLYVSYCLKIRLTTFYPTLFRHIVSSVLLLAVFSIIRKIYYPNSWIGLIMVAIVCAIIGAILHALIVFDSEDRKTIIQKLDRRRIKR